MIAAAASAVIWGTWKPQRAFSADAPATRTVLIVASGANTLALRNGTFPIGVFLNELAIPAMELRKAGYALVLATPQGNKPTIDKRSVNETYFAGKQALEEAQSFMEHDPAMQNPRSLPSLLEEGVDQYAGLFVPGGHGPVVDLIQDPSLGIILRRFHELRKPTALLCHGPAALISAMKSAPQFCAAMQSRATQKAKGLAEDWIYAGYRVTTFSAEEEASVEKNVFQDEAPIHTDTALATAGATVTRGEKPFESHVVQDRELITGQNPRSDQALASRLIEALSKHRP